MRKPKSIHVSVRLGAQHAAQLKYWQDRTGFSQGGIINAAMDALDAILVANRRGTFKRLQYEFHQAAAVKAVRDEADARVAAIRKGEPVPADAGR